MSLGSRALRCLALGITALSLCALPRWPGARAEHLVQSVPIVFHVAEQTLYGSALQPFVARQLAHANATFAPLAISFRDAGRAPLPPRSVSLETRAHRDALLALVQPGAVHCFVVSRLMDVDEPGRERRGVHWHPSKADRPHLVVVSTLASDYVLAHELAHYFGNPTHSQVDGNILSYVWSSEPPFFSDDQRRRVERALERMRRAGEL